jgi:sec-independent protein translocase protein TatC
MEASDTLTGHLEELRTRLIRSIVAILVVFLACFLGYSEYILDFARKPIVDFLPSGGLVFTAPMDKFMAHIKVSLLASIILTCPIWLYQMFKFVSPGLYKNERKYSVLFILFGTVLFLTGASFVYFVVFPMAFEFLLQFGGMTDAPMITISEYLSFFILTTLVFGFMFELPLFLSILGMMGLITKSFLIKQRRYAIVILSVLSAMVTPPDVISMLCMMGPLILLYELSVFLVGVLEKPKDIAESESQGLTP